MAKSKAKPKKPTAKTKTARRSTAAAAFKLNDTHDETPIRVVIDATKPADVLRRIPLSLIDVSPYNPRGPIDRTTPEFLEFVASVKEHGVLQPLIVRIAGAERYELIFGHRRFAALEVLAAPDAPCFVRSIDDVGTVRALQIIENLQRVDIAPMDEANAFVSLQAEDPDRWTAAAIGRAIGKSDRFVAQRMALARNLAPELQEKLKAGTLTIEVARTLAGAPKTMQKKIAGDFYASRDAESARSKMLDLAVPLGTNAFKAELYTGDYIEDGDKKWFADVAQFDRLQKVAAETAVEKLRRKWFGASLVTSKQLSDYVYADDGSWISTWSTRATIGKRAKGLAASDVTALVYLHDHKIKTLEGVVARETWNAKVKEEEAGDDTAEPTHGDDDPRIAATRTLNEELMNEMQARPDLAKRLLVYACIGNLSELSYEGDIKECLGPWRDQLADLVDFDANDWDAFYEPASSSDDPLIRLLLRLDEPTIDAMFGRLMAWCAALTPFHRAYGYQAAVFAAAGLTLPDDKLPKMPEPAAQAEAA